MIKIRKETTYQHHILNVLVSYFQDKKHIFIVQIFE